jgi:hypothetical protein
MKHLMDKMRLSILTIALTLSSGLIACVCLLVATTLFCQICLMLAVHAHNMLFPLLNYLGVDHVLTVLCFVAIL